MEDLVKLNLKNPIDIELEKGATPYYGGYYSVPHMLQKPLKKEVNRMVEADILKRLPFDKDTPWGAPSFCQPKKDQGIRFLTDFRQINKRIKRKPFPLPKIVEALKKIERFKSATAIDLSQGYYHLPLSERAQAILTTVLPWGQICLQKITYGLSLSTRHIPIYNDRFVS